MIKGNTAYSLKTFQNLRQENKNKGGPSNKKSGRRKKDDRPFGVFSQKEKQRNTGGHKEGKGVNLDSDCHVMGGLWTKSFGEKEGLGKNREKCKGGGGNKTQSGTPRKEVKKNDKTKKNGGGTQKEGNREKEKSNGNHPGFSEELLLRGRYKRGGKNKEGRSPSHGGRKKEAPPMEK